MRFGVRIIRKNIGAAGKNCLVGNVCTQLHIGLGQVGVHGEEVYFKHKRLHLRHREAHAFCKHGRRVDLKIAVHGACFFKDIAALHDRVYCPSGQSHELRSKSPWPFQRSQNCSNCFCISARNPVISCGTALTPEKIFPVRVFNSDLIIHI